MSKTYTPPAISAQAQHVLADLDRAAQIALAGGDEALCQLLIRTAAAFENTLTRHHELRRHGCPAAVADAALAEGMVWTSVVDATHIVALFVIAKAAQLAVAPLVIGDDARAMVDAWHRTAPGGTA